MQSRKKSALESTANFITAFILGYIVTYFVVPMIWGTTMTAGQPVGFVLLLNILSTLRHYVWRRVFNKLDAAGD